MIAVMLLTVFFQPEVTAEEVAAAFEENAMRAETLRVE